ncbi:MAG TPA: hypothetical protein VGN14_12855 [Candidatus Elarobacter sp.]|jgi:hypothetical protein
MTRRSLAALMILAAASTAPAFAQTTGGSAKAAALATQKAKQFLVQLERRNGSSVNGTVGMTVIGRTRTRINVQLANPVGHPLSLAVVPGSDCVDNRETALANAIPLNPVNSSQLSSTIVSVPINQLRGGNYVVQIRDATARQQITEACARLNR